VKYGFIQSDLTAYPIAISCDVLEVARSGYYDWAKRPISPQRQRREELGMKIKEAHEDNRGVYGSRRVCQALRAQGETVCVNTVAKIMKEDGIQAESGKKFVPCTTDSNHDLPVAENILDRQFTAELPDQKWAGDITYIQTNEGWLYMACVIDLCSRMIVGWSMADHMETDLVSDALKMAIARRQPAEGLLFHSDRGSQYASDDYQHLLQEHKIQPSMSRKGNCWDNACTESFWATFKTELVYRQQYATRDQAKQSIFEYVEVFYNRKRLHSSLDYLSPEAFEASLR
jgi:transposase InsO family protein